MTKGHPETRSVEGSALVVLSKRDVEALLPMRECIGLMEGALVTLARGEVVHPLRPVVPVAGTKNVFAVMPAYSSALEAFSTKIISVYPDNHGTGIDSHQGLVVLFEGRHGSPVAMMDAASITAIRTAAVSGVATMVLANRDVSTLAILGAGVQARTHVEAMLVARKFSRVLIWARAREKAQRLADELSAKHNVSFSAARDARDAVSQADVVCTVTASREPVLRGEWLRPGTHINAVGASIATARELDTEAVRRARIFVDRRESALAEAGDLLIPIKEGAIAPTAIIAELGELLVDRRQARGSRDEITLFKSLGLAVEDLVCANYLRRAAEQTGAGTHVRL